jgi:hypothetical protein
MANKGSKEQMDNTEESPTKRAKETHSGTPNATNPNDHKSGEHKSGYGGDGGEPRTDSSTRPGK